MSLAFRIFRLYLRVILVFGAAAAIGLVLFKNRSNRVSFWFFGLADNTAQVNVVWLILWTAIATLVSWWIFSFGWGLWRDLREVKRARAADELERSHQARAAELAERERRLDEKIKRAIGSNENGEHED